MKTNTLNAVTLRIILSVTMFIIVIIAGAIFYFATTRLEAVAIEANHSTIDAESSEKNIQALKKVEEELVLLRETMNRTSSIVADSQSYQYQNQIITDLNDYARTAGIGITNIDFSSSGSAAAAPAPGVAPTAPATAPAGASTVKTTSVAATLATPVDYTKLLTFVRLIEQNLTKMQLSKINLTRSEVAGQVTTDVLTLEVYIQ